MKNPIIIFALCLSIHLSFAQGIINDIMLVETVSIDLSSVNEKRLSKYNETFEKEFGNMEKDIADIDKKYKEEVSKHVEDFTNTLKDGEEQEVSSLKLITVSRVSSLTMTHQWDKKTRVQDFLNAMQIANRKLPHFMKENASTKVKDIGSSYFETIKNDYKAHIETVSTFEAQEHLIITEEISEGAN